MNFYLFKIESEKARYVIVTITNFLGTFAGFFVNIVASDFYAKLIGEKSEENKPPQVIVPPIKIENFIQTAPETKQPETITPVESKFYPISFVPDLKFFVGRETLMRNLEKKLKNKHRASIHDISGLGKTFSTYKFAETNQEKYEKIFFVRANKEEMLQSLAEIGVWLSPFLKDEPDQSKQAHGFKRWLEENDKWLVIYDNVDVPNELKPYVPLNLNGDCLFTSNFRSIENLAEYVEITKLSNTDARNLLFSRAKKQIDATIRFENDEEKESFKKIVEEIDGHPLSLNTTGAYISENTISFAEYLRKLKRTPLIMLENEDGYDKYHHKSALKAFSIAIDDIGNRKSFDKFDNSAELAKKLLSAVSFLAPDDIPERLLQEILTEIAKIDFNSEENEDLWLEIRAKLLAYDLLKYEINKKNFTTHRLIQKVIQSKLKDDEITVFCNVSLIAVDKLFPFSKHETKKECEIYFPHAVALINKTEEINVSSEQIANIYHKVGRHLSEIVKYQQAIGYLEKEIMIYRNLPEKENVNLSNALNELAIIYQLQGRYEEAIEKYQEALQIDERTIGKEHPEYAIRLNNLAIVYQSQGRYEEAIKKYQEVLQIDERTIGKEHPSYAIDLNNLALVYQSQGRYEEAIEKYQEALQIGERTIGKEHPNYAIRLSNLAIVYQSQGRYEEAIEKYQESLQIGERTIGKEHPDYATRLNNLALVYQSQGRYEEAIEKYQEALQIGERTIGKEHPNYAIRLNNLADVYELQEKINDALELYKDALRIFQKTLPENHPYIKQLRESVKRCEQKVANEKKD